ncbi:MAG: hypothetical protein ACXWRU_17045 [Pseudobdellovibrionaceae bacterium]
MKKALLTAAMVVMGSVSQAKVLCNISGESLKQHSIFDRPLYSSEITSQKMVVVSDDTSNANELVLENPRSLIQWQFLAGKTAVFISQKESSVYISIGNLFANKTNEIMSTDAATAGEVSPTHPLILMSHHISATCYSL